MTRRTRRGAVRWGILLFGLLVVGALVGLLYQGFGKDPHALPSTLEGRTAPPFQLVTMDGRPVSLEGLQGKPVVLNFWATWCVPCAQEHAILQEGARAYSKQGVVFLGVLYNDKPDLAAGFLEKRGSAYPTLLDPTGSTAVDFGVSGVPETFFIDPDGVIARKVTGPVSTSVLVTAIEEMLWRLLLLAALAAGPASAEAPPPPGTPETALAEPFGEPLTDGAEIEARTLTLAHGLRCPVCQGMSVADSSSEAAVNMKNRIRELVTAGYTDDQIEDYFIDRYGTWVLLEPPDDGVNRALYLAPGAALLVGLGVVGWVLTARRRRDAAPPAPTPNPTDDAYTRRVLAELEED